MASKKDKNDKLSARERRLALEKQMASKSKQEAPKADSKAKKGGKDTDKPSKTAKAPRSKRKKVLLISLGSLLFIILAFLGTLGLMWLNAGSTYDKKLTTLVPSDALLVVTFENLGADLAELDTAIEAIYKGRKGVKALERSALWRKSIDATFKALHQEKFKSGLASARSSVSSMPIDMTLEEDLLGNGSVIALIPNKDKEKTENLILTRVSQEVAFGWKFRGFGEGKQGQTTIGSHEDWLTISGNGPDTTYLGLFDDVLAISSSPQVLTKLSSRFELEGKGGFEDLALTADAREKLAASKLKGLQIQAFANLEAIREYQGPDPEDVSGRASIDTYFSPSRDVLSMSGEIMPTIQNVLDHSIDTRLYEMAAWKVQLTPKEAILVDQYLIAPEGKIDTYPKVKTAMSTSPAEMDFLKFLPQGTWLAATMRQPIEEIRKATKPPLDETGKPRDSAIYSFMKALESHDGVEPDAIGLALLPERFSTLKANDQRPIKARQPPTIVSKLPFPPFALFLHWPGVSDADVHSLLSAQLKDLGAQTTTIVRKSITGKFYLAIHNNDLEKEGSVGWLNNIAAIAFDDYLVFTYGGYEGRQANDPNGTSGYHTVVKAIWDVAKNQNQEVSMQRDLKEVWKAVDSKHNALVHINPKGFISFANNTGLVQKLADSKYSEDAPFGMSTTRFRALVKKELREAGKPADEDSVTAEYRRRIQAWLSKEKAPYQSDLLSNFQALDFMKDFSAHTLIEPETMHTRFVIRLNR